MKYTILLCLVSCAAWKPTPNANIRRREAAHLAICLGNRQDSRFFACAEESKRRCRESGLEAACGIDEFWGRVK